MGQRSSLILFKKKYQIIENSQYLFHKSGNFFLLKDYFLRKMFRQFFKRLRFYVSNLIICQTETKIQIIIDFTEKKDKISQIFTTNKYFKIKRKFYLAKKKSKKFKKIFKRIFLKWLQYKYIKRKQAQASKFIIHYKPLLLLKKIKKKKFFFKNNQIFTKQYQFFMIPFVEFTNSQFKTNWNFICLKKYAKRRKHIKFKVNKFKWKKLKKFKNPKVRLIMLMIKKHKIFNKKTWRKDSNSSFSWIWYKFFSLYFLKKKQRQNFFFFLPKKTIIKTKQKNHPILSIKKYIFFNSCFIWHKLKTHFKKINFYKLNFTSIKFLLKQLYKFKKFLILKKLLVKKTQKLTKKHSKTLFYLLYR